ncbi:MAG: cereblon family protein [Gammaproteobacteria bacterium]|nr:cereblon family protein [Gammaproteobacteria bacterium]
MADRRLDPRPAWKRLLGQCRLPRDPAGVSPPLSAPVAPAFRSIWLWPAGIFPPGIVAFDALADREVEDLLDEEKAAQKDPSPLLCAACGLGITSRRERVDMNGAHAHTFTNPHGLTFEIGCFGFAENCRLEGEATTAWTWFSGYAWRVCVCTGCSTHLGWAFEAAPPRAGDRGFYGLILDRLTSPD